jgi:amino acid adenylation domain-containing protein
MVPAAFVGIDAVPLTSSGKVDRRALPAPPAPDARPEPTRTEPRTDLERALAGVWSEVLQANRPGIHDDFFESGGHSLLAIQLLGRLRSLFGVELPPHALLSAPTIALLAEAVERARQSNAPAPRIVRADVSGPQPPSFAQERFWFLHRLHPESPAYNVLGVFPISPPADAVVVGQALAALARRHDALRMSFAELDGEPRLIVSPAVALPVVDVDLRSRPIASRDEAWIELAKSENRRRFDLTRAPLAHATLVRRSDSDQALLLALHHSIVDEWSLAILERELSELLAASREGRDPGLPALPFGYADFARWQRAELQGPRRRELRDFWMRALAGAPTILELPSDRPRPEIQTFRGAVETFDLRPQLAESLKRLGRQERATLFMTLLAGFMTLLHRQTGHDDLLVGTPIAGRNEAGTEAVVGLFLNTIALRARFEPDLTFRDLLRQVRETATAAYQHQDLPFDQVVADLAVGRAPNRSPLCQIMFLLFDASDAEAAPGPETLAALSNGTSKFDLTLGIAERARGLEGWVEYSTDLFESSTIRRLIDQFSQVLEAVSEHPGRPIGRLDLASDEERELLLAAGTGPSAAPWSGSLCDAVNQSAERAPERLAAASDALRLTYGDLVRRANRLANHLKHSGVERGALVGVAVERSAEMLVTLLGVLKAGAAYVPLDPAFPPARLSFMLRDSGVAALVTQGTLADAWPERPARVIRLDADAAAIGAESDADPGVPVGPADLAYVLYTSGSTGTPKGVEIPHGALMNLLRSMQQEPGLGPDDVLLAVTTLSFDIAGLELYLPLVAGGTVVIAGRDEVQDPARLMRRLDEADVTVMQATPSLWRALVDAGWSGRAGLKALCGGEPMPPALATALLGRCRELWNMYGPTETTIWSTCRRITDEAAIDLGRPIAGTELLVLSDGRLVPVGVAGELHIGGAGLARGYRDRPELTAERFVPHPYRVGHRLYRTGDRVRWQPGGRLEFLGRDDGQVKIRGHRIELGEVEAALGSHPSVRQAVAVARPDAAGDQYLVAFVEGASDASALRDHVRRVLPDYAVPSAFVAVSTWPLTPNGKVDRHALPASAGPAMPATFSEPSNETERRLAAIWRDLLDVSSVGRRDDFFLLGGHSLLAMRLIDRVHKAFDVALSPADLFRHPTLAGLAGRVDAARPASDAGDDLLVQIEKGGAGTPFFWVHGIGGEVFSFMQVSKHLGAHRPVYGFAADWTRRPAEGPISVERMATVYVARLRSVQPHGPYFLGGFCAGSMIALEMARQLESSGERVGLLASIDWDIDAPAEPGGVRRVAAFLRNAPR